MSNFLKKIEVRWSDLDPNFHVRHSAYYDYAASARIEFLQQNGISLEVMREQSFGLVIFREECIFRKELTINDHVSIDIHLLRATSDYSRWSIQHTIFKNDNIVSAILTLDGAWIDVNKRKLMLPPEEVTENFAHIPRASNFEWVIKSIK